MTKLQIVLVLAAAGVAAAMNPSAAIAQGGVGGFGVGGGGFQGGQPGVVGGFGFGFGGGCNGNFFFMGNLGNAFIGGGPLPVIPPGGMPPGGFPLPPGGFPPGGFPPQFGVPMGLGFMGFMPCGGPFANLMKPDVQKDLQLTNEQIKKLKDLQSKDPDPTLHASRFNRTAIKESELCKEMNVDYRFIYVQLLPDDQAGKLEPPAIAEFLKIMDDPNSYPVLIHCKAGLHRTGVMAAIYRMEYNGWSREDAMRELKAHGFGQFFANTSNPYIQQYVMPYQPRSKQQS